MKTQMCTRLASGEATNSVSPLPTASLSGDSWILMGPMVPNITATVAITNATSPFKVVPRPGLVSALLPTHFIEGPSSRVLDGMLNAALWVVIDNEQTGGRD